MQLEPNPGQNDEKDAFVNKASNQQNNDENRIENWLQNNDETATHENFDESLGKSSQNDKINSQSLGNQDFKVQISESLQNQAHVHEINIDVPASDVVANEEINVKHWQNSQVENISIEIENRPSDSGTQNAILVENVRIEEMND